MTIHVGISDMRVLAAIEETGSQEGAGKKVGMAAGTVSQRIRALEAAYDVELVRHEPGVSASLTRAGRVLLDYARKILRQVEMMNEEVLGFSKGVVGDVMVLSNTNAMTEFLPEVLGDFLRANPGINIDLQERLSDDIVRLIAEGEGDIGIVAGNVDNKALDFQPFHSDRLVVVTASEHELVGRKGLGFADIAGYDFVGLDRASSLQEYIDSKAEALNRKLHLRVQLRGFDAVCRLVSKNVGVAIIPKTAALRCQATTKIKILDLADDWAVRKLKIIWRREELRASASRLLDHLRKAGEH